MIYLLMQKKKCLETLTIFEHMILNQNPQLGLQSIRLRLLKTERISDIQNNFEHHCVNEYREVKEIVRRRGTKNEGFFSPSNPLLWILFLFFAWNEMCSLLKNPLLLLLVICIGIIIYFFYSSNWDIQNGFAHNVEKIINIVVKCRDLMKSHKSSTENLEQTIHHDLHPILYPYKQSSHFSYENQNSVFTNNNDVNNKTENNNNHNHDNNDNNNKKKIINKQHHNVKHYGNSEK